MGDPNLWGRGGPDSKAIRQSLNQIASDAASQARSFGYSQSYSAPAAGETEPAPAKAAGLTPPRYGGTAAAPAAPGFQLPKLPEIKLELPQIQDLSKLMQQSPIPGVGGLGHALEQAAGETKVQWNPAGIRDVPILSTIPRGLEMVANVTGEYNKELEPVRGYYGQAGAFPSLGGEPLRQVSELLQGRGGLDIKGAVQSELAKPGPLAPAGIAWRMLESGPALAEKSYQIGANFAKRKSEGVALSDNLGRALGEWRNLGQDYYDALPADRKIIADIAVDPLSWIPGAGVGKAQKGKLVAEAMTPIEGGLRTTEQLIHKNVGWGRFLPWDPPSRLHETVKTAFQSMADSTLNAPDFATALNNIAKWGGAGTEGGFNALKALLGKPNLSLYEQRAARLLAGYPERVKNIEKAYNTLGRDLTSLRAVDPKKMPAGPLREVVKTIQAKSIDDAAEIGRLIDDAAREHLAHDATFYMAEEANKVLKIPPPNVAQRFLDNVLRPLEAIAYIGTNPVSIFRNWANNKASLMLEGATPWMNIDARIVRLEAAGVTGIAAELRKAERTYQALAQTELAVAKATGRANFSGTGLLGQMGGAIGKFGREKTLLGMYAKLEQADRKIVNLHGFEQGLRNWKVATKGSKGWVPELPAAVLAHLTPDDAKRIYAAVRDAGPNAKALREGIDAVFGGHAPTLDYEAMAKGLSEVIAQRTGKPVTLSEDAAREIMASGGIEAALQEAAANITKRMRKGSESYDLVRNDELGKVAQRMLARFKQVTPEETAFTKALGKYDYTGSSVKEIERQWNQLIRKGERGLRLTEAEQAQMAALRSERAKRGLSGVAGPKAGPAAPSTPVPSPKGPKGTSPKGFPSQIKREEYQLSAQGFDPMQVAEIMNNPRLRRWWRSRNDMVDTLKTRNVPKQELDATIAKWEKRNPMPKGMTPEPQMPIEPPEKAAPPVVVRATVDDLRKLARDKGISTAGETGIPNDAHLVSALNKTIQEKGLTAKPFTAPEIKMIEGERRVANHATLTQELKDRADEAKGILDQYVPEAKAGVAAAAKPAEAVAPKAAEAATEAADFTQWFGKSQVVDESGKPLTLYHGTNARFKKFSLKKTGSATDEGWWGDGFYFSNKKETAQGYGKNLIKVNVRMEKPFLFPYDPHGKTRLPSDVLAQLPEFVPDPETFLPTKTRYADLDLHDFFETQRGLAEDASAPIMRAGYDGIIVETNRSGAREYMVWDPKQVKQTIPAPAAVTAGPGSFAAERQYEWTPAMEREQRRLANKQMKPATPLMLRAQVGRGEITKEEASRLMQQGGQLTDKELARLRELDEIKERFMAGEVLSPSRTPTGADLLEESQRQLRELAVDEQSARALGVTAQQQSEAQQFGEVLAIVRELWAKQAPAITGAETRNAVMGWLERDVIPITNDARVAAQKLGDWVENAAVLNYNGRNFVDNASTPWIPFGFFRFHYGQETLRRVVDRPALANLYLKLADSLDSVQDDPAYPARLRGKTRIAVPFLPGYMGGEVFFDPLEQIAPVKQVFALNQFQQTGEVDDGDVAQSIRALALRGAVDQSSAANAIANKDQSELWRQTKARLTQMQGETQGLNSFSDLFQPHAPVDIAWKVLTGRPQDVGPLFPITRLVKGATAGLVPGGINIEQPVKAGLRKLTGEPNIPDYDAFEQYRVDRELANMVAEGRVSERDAYIAMMERTGKDYETAKQRVGETTGISALSGVAAQVFPEGERAYYKARLARDQLLEQEILKAGGTPTVMTTDQKWDFVKANKLFTQGSALSKFYDQHPELGVKSAVFNENEGRLKDFLVSGLWEEYNKLDKLNKSLVSKQMPPEFKANFLDKEGRGADYSNVTLEDLATWAQKFHMYVPKAAGINIQPKAAPDLRFAPPEQARKYEEWRNRVAATFNMTKLQPLLNEYHSLPKSQGGGLTVQQRQFRQMYPEVDRYQKMYSQFLRQNPDIAFVLNPQGQRFYATQATYGTAVTGLQKMIRQMTQPRR